MCGGDLRRRVRTRPGRDPHPNPSPQRLAPEARQRRRARLPGGCSWFVVAGAGPANRLIDDALRNLG